MTRHNRRSVLFVDLDGTLTDPAEGIVGWFRFALEAMGRSPPPAAELTWIIGPPLRRSFAEVLGGTGDPEEALSIYRGRYSTEGLFEAVVYDGVREAWRSFARQGRDCFCAPQSRPFTRSASCAISIFDVISRACMAPNSMAATRTKAI